MNLHNNTLNACHPHTCNATKHHNSIVHFIPSNMKYFSSTICSIIVLFLLLFQPAINAQDSSLIVIQMSQAWGGSSKHLLATFVYNQEGLLKLIESRSLAFISDSLQNDPKSQYWTVYEYDKKGNLVSETLYREYEGIQTALKKTEYSYEDKKQWVKGMDLITRDTIVDVFIEELGDHHTQGSITKKYRLLNGPIGTHSFEFITSKSENDSIRWEAVWFSPSNTVLFYKFELSQPQVARSQLFYSNNVAFFKSKDLKLLEKNLQEFKEGFNNYRYIDTQNNLVKMESGDTNGIDIKHFIKFSYDKKTGLIKHIKNRGKMHKTGERVIHELFFTTNNAGKRYLRTIRKNKQIAKRINEEIIRIRFPVRFMEFYDSRNGLTSVKDY